MRMMNARDTSLVVIGILMAGGLLVPPSMGPGADAGSSWYLTSESDFKSTANGTSLSNLVVTGSGDSASLELSNAYAGWQQKSPPTPPSARGTVMAGVYNSDQAMLFGGYSGLNEMSDTWVYDLSDNRWTQKYPMSNPSGRRLAPMATIQTDDKVLLYAGYSAVDLSDTWVYDLSDNQWYQRSPGTNPGVRDGHGMAGISGDDTAVMFGGYIDFYTMSYQTWVYDLSDNSWRQQSTSSFPTARAYFGMATVSGDDKVVLFGGSDGSTVLGDTWVFDLGDGQWTHRSPMNNPPARDGCSMATIYGMDQVILYGGATSTGAKLSDTWVYDISDDQWYDKSAATRPPKRDFAAMTSLYGTGYSLLYGGYDATYKSDTWTHSSSGYAPTGYFCSPGNDMGGNCSFKSFEWNADTPAGTSVQVQLRAGTSEVDLQSKPFVGPNGDGAAFYTSSGGLLWTGHKGRWAQYKVTLTTNSTSTPRLQAITLRYNLLPEPPTLTGPTNGTWLHNFRPTFSWDHRDTDGSSQTGFAWELSSTRDFIKTTLSSGEQQSSASTYNPDMDIADGLWYWHVKTCDDEGDWGPYSAYSIIGIDSTPPKAFTPVITPSNWTNHKPQISFLTSDPVSGIGRYEVSIDDGTFTEHASPYVPDQMPDGEHTVTVRAFDRAGNFVQGKATYYKDTASPDDFTPVATPAGWSSKSPRVFFSTNDSLSGVDRYEVKVDKGQYSPQLSPYAVPDLPDGNHTVTVKAVDKAENYNERSLQIFIDKGPPAPFTAVAEPAGWTKLDPRLSFEAVDPVSGIDRYEVRVEGGAFEKRASPCTLDGLEDGEHNVTVRAYDRAGNYQDSKTKVQVDFAPPVQVSLRINNRAQGTTERRVMLVIGATDVTSGVDKMCFSEDGVTYGQWEPFTLQIGHDLVGGVGKKTVYMKVKDRAGNEAPVVTASIIYDPEYGKQDNSIWVVLLVLVITAAAGAGGFMYWRRLKAQKAAMPPPQPPMHPMAGMEYVPAPPPEYVLPPAQPSYQGYQYQTQAQPASYQQAQPYAYPSTGQYPDQAQTGTAYAAVGQAAGYPSATSYVAPGAYDSAAWAPRTDEPEPARKRPRPVIPPPEAPAAVAPPEPAPQEGPAATMPPAEAPPAGTEQGAGPPIEPEPVAKGPYFEPAYELPHDQRVPAYQEPPVEPEPAYQGPPAEPEPAYQEPPVEPEPAYQEPPAEPEPAYQEPPAGPGPAIEASQAGPEPPAPTPYVTPPAPAPAAPAYAQAATPAAPAAVQAPQQAVYVFDRATGKYTFVSNSMVSPQSVAGLMTPTSMLVATSGGKVYSYFDAQSGRWVATGK